MQSTGAPVACKLRLYLHEIIANRFIMLSASSGKHNVTLWRPSVRLSVHVSRLFLTLIERAAHTQCDSPGGSTRHGQRTFPSEYYEDGHVCTYLCTTHS